MQRRVRVGCLAAFLALSLTQAIPAPVLAQKAVSLSDKQVENIVRRSYQYVAMYNVIQKLIETDLPGFNKPLAKTELLDHTVKAIARPNNDTLYQMVVLDLRNEPVVVEYPAIDSSFVALETSGYAHYCEMPLLSAKGDFKKPTKVLFYTDRTKGYRGEKIRGVDRAIEADGDFFYAFLRAMPHQSDPQRMAEVIKALQSVTVVTLSEFQGKPAKASEAPKFPAHSKTDADVFANNLLEVMQFIFNYTTFDPNNEMDQAVLAAYEPLGVAPGKTFDASKVAKLDGKQFRKIAGEVARKALAAMADKAVAARLAPTMFIAEGQDGPRDAGHVFRHGADWCALLCRALSVSRDQRRPADERQARLRAEDDQGPAAPGQSVLVADAVRSQERFLHPERPKEIQRRGECRLQAGCQGWDRNLH